jgi:hypothetical protein
MLRVLVANSGIAIRVVGAAGLCVDLIFGHGHFPRDRAASSFPFEGRVSNPMIG